MAIPYDMSRFPCVKRPVINKIWQYTFGTPFVWVVLLMTANLPLFWADVRSELIFMPDAVFSGQWWRIVTYPLVHMSWYHLLLDGGAFLLLFPFLEEKRIGVKTIYLIATSAGTLLLASALNPAIAQRGLSGLSGIAHGLMAISALEMLRHPGQRIWGLFSLAAVITKSAYELFAGHVVFEFLHMGLCGHPVAQSHAGGVMGGLIAFAFIHYRTISLHCRIQRHGFGKQRT